MIAGVVIAAGGGTAIALAAAGSGPIPRPKPLPRAIHDALSAPQIAGITARITFTNHLISASNIQGSDPLLTGASGRLWLDPSGHRLRIELQGNNGDAQVVVNGRSAFISDPSMHIAYRFTLPAPGAEPKTVGGADQVPSLANIQQELTKLAQHVDISGAQPSDVAHHAAYTVSVSPRHAGGLLGSAQLAWDAVRGVPLRFAIYAHSSNGNGHLDRVLELKVDKISYSAIKSKVFQIQMPSGAKLVSVAGSTSGAGKEGKRARKGHHAPVNGKAAVARRLPFALAAPAQLVGLSRHSVTLLNWGGHPAALVTYGQNLGGVAVIEQRADAAAAKPATTSGHGDRQGLSLPTVAIGHATGQELDTALGTVVRFTRAGVSYTVIGSVPATAADAAARAL
ncbi:MAG TPA: hypothetical protein VLP43_04255 [Solirubrobacteraceae bacterium]|nr:hypothetical protein [Solirubrobacteraceae bacterium]